MAKRLSRAAQALKKGAKRVFSHQKPEIKPVFSEPSQTESASGHLGKTDSVDQATSPGSLGLAEVLAALGADLVKARSEAVKGSAFGLYVSQAELELQFTVSSTTTASGEAGVKFHVVTLGGSGSHEWAKEQVQRIQLTLVTTDPTAKDTPVTQTYSRSAIPIDPSQLYRTYVFDGTEDPRQSGGVTPEPVVIDPTKSPSGPGPVATRTKNLPDED
jgi:Trypsin-co-occurring domain 2